MRQWAVVSRAQLLAAGLSPSAIEERLRSGHLHRVHQGVYAVGTPPHCREAWWMAAALALGGHVSHRSAAAHWGFWDNASSAVHVTTARGRRPRPGLVPHGDRLDDRDRRVHRAIPVVSPAMALLQLATQTSADQLDRALNDARAAGLVRPGDERDVVARHPKHKGAARLTALLAGPLTRSELERAFARIAVAPCRNHRIEGFEIDNAWPGLRLVVELDGARNHTTPARIAADARKQALLEAAGWRVVRLTWWDVVRDEARTRERLRALGVVCG